MKARGLTWLGLALAMSGPGVVALASRAAAGGGPATLATAAPWLAAFTALVAAVAAIGVFGEGLGAADLGLGHASWVSAPLGLTLAAFFILIYGPAAYWALAKTGLGSFATGAATMAALPRWFLALDIVVVAAGEEWLYRAYAIERLQAITGSPVAAGAISLATFALVHLPLWGPGVALTTLVSGGVFTLLYLWRRDISALMLAHVLTDLYGLLLAPGLAR